MNARSQNSARSGGVSVAVLLIIFWLAGLFLAISAEAKPPNFKIESVGQYGERLKALPVDITSGEETEYIDRRMYKDVVRLMRKYRQILTDGYATEGHTPTGDHPKGVGFDTAPDTDRNGPSGTWEDTRRLAVYLGWQPVGFKGCETGDMGCSNRLASLSTPARWIGYNGTRCHGDPANIFGSCGPHLHVSFKSSPTPTAGWPKRVTRFAISDSDKNDREPEEVIEKASPAEGAGGDTDQYPVDIPEYADISEISPADELADTESVPLNQASETPDSAADSTKSSNLRAKSVDLPRLEAIVNSINKTIESGPALSGGLEAIAPSDEVDLQSVVSDAMNTEVAKEADDDSFDPSADPNAFSKSELSAIAEADELVGEEVIEPSEPTPVSPPVTKLKKSVKRKIQRFGQYRMGDQYWYYANYRSIGWVQRLPGPPVIRKRAAEVAWKVNAAAKKYHIEPELLAALIYHESGFQRTIPSSALAVGYTQLMPATARSMGVTDRTNAQQNINGGARYLRLLLNRFRGKLPISLRGYNAGPNAPWNAVAGYDSRIMNLRDHLRRKR